MVMASSLPMGRFASGDSHLMPKFILKLIHLRTETVDFGAQVIDKPVGLIGPVIAKRPELAFSAQSAPIIFGRTAWSHS